MEGCSDVAKVPDKSPVKVGKPQELLNLFATIRCRPLSHSTDFSWVHLHLSRGYDEAQEGYSVSMKLALFSFDVQFVLQQSLENLTNMVNMGVRVWGKDQDII